MTEEDKKWVKKFWTPCHEPFEHPKKGDKPSELRIRFIKAKDFWEESDRILKEDIIK